MFPARRSESPETNLSRYLQQIRAFPFLSPEEELELASRWRACRDVKAADKLVTSHLRLVAKIAMQYRSYGLPVGDLISEGNVGMVKAVQRFDPSHGVRLATYASWWIRAAIQEFVLHSWSLVKIGTTAAQKTLFFNLRRLKGQMRVLDEADLTAEQVANIAQALHVRAQDVVNMNLRLQGHDHSLNGPTRDDSGDEWQDWLVDESQGQDTVLIERDETSRQKVLVAGAWTTLKDRERQILAARRLKDNPATLEELAQRFGISRERVRQIEVRAMEKLRRTAHAHTAGHHPAQGPLLSSGAA